MGEARAHPCAHPERTGGRLRRDRPAAVNPWDVEDPRELPTDKLQYLLALHSFFLGTQTQDGTYDLSPTDESLLSRAIREVYKRCAASGDYGTPVTL